MLNAARGGFFLEQQQNIVASTLAASPCNVLMIYPRFMADSFWNFSEACELVGARYPAIPLGLITVAALLPKSWNIRLVNRNTEELADGDLDWADMVMTGGMLFQQSDTLELIAMCRARGLPVVIGGPDGDCGLTGRKIIVDTYGGAAPHGGGAFSGKDSTKVDRSAAYAARYLAKNVVAAGLADRCTIQIAYAIGVSDPLSVYVDTHGTGKMDETKLERVLPQLMSLKPRGIREHLGLNKPIYARTSAYGHFGREPDSEGGFSWEKTDLAEKLKSAV